MNQLYLHSRMLMIRLSRIVGRVGVRMDNGNTIDNVGMRKECYARSISNEEYRQGNPYYIFHSFI